MLKPDVPHSRGKPEVAPVPAAFRLDNDQAVRIPIEVLANKVCAAIAGRAAHEILEFVRFDGDFVVDPHGSAAQIAGIAELVTEYLVHGAEFD